MKKKYIRPRIEGVYTIPENDISITVTSFPDDPANADAKRRSSFADDDEDDPDDDGGDGGNSGNYWGDPWE